MVTCLYGIDRVNGAELTALLYGVCLISCICGGLLFRRNRTASGRKRLLLGIAVTACLCDALLFLALFPGGEYRNYGIGAVYGMICYPVSLVFVTTVLTAWNYQYEYEDG